VTVSVASDVYFDPYDVTLNADPYPMFRRLREHAPLCCNEEHGFYALSRFDDVDRALVEYQTFSSARDVNFADCKLSPTSTARGWDTMPALLV
jgi:cytochrome P450